MSTRQFEFNYELNYINSYDANVLAASGSADKDSAELQALIEKAVADIVLVMGLYSGVNTMTSFVEYNNARYKITMNKA